MALLDHLSHLREEQDTHSLLTCYVEEASDEDGR
jgi:hypothetical protein